MITVQGKVLEVGDTAVFRCGGKAVVTEIKSYQDQYIKSTKFNMVYFNDFMRIECKEDGRQSWFEKEKYLIDIIDIIKAPKPEIVEICYFPDYCNEKIKVIVDKTNQKILSVGIV